MRTDERTRKARITQIDAERMRRRARRRRDRRRRRLPGRRRRATTSRRSAAAAPISPPSRWPPRSRPTCARSTPTSTASTPPIPNVVPDARKLARVTYDEMLELASLGAKVLQTRSVEFAKKYGVPVHVRSTFKPDPGTLVTEEEAGMEEAVVTGVTARSEPGEDLDPARARPARHRRAGLRRPRRQEHRRRHDRAEHQPATATPTSPSPLPRGDLARARRGCSRGGRPRDRRARASCTTSGWPRSPSSASACAATPAWPRRCSRTLAARGHQHPDDLDLGDRGLLRDRGQVRRAGGAGPARRLRRSARDGVRP